MNRALPCLLLACALTPGALANDDPFIADMEAIAARDTGAALERSPAIGVATYVMVRTLPESTHGFRLRANGRLTRAALHISDQAMVSELGAEQTQQILTSAVELLSSGHDGVEESAADLHLRVGLGGETVSLYLRRDDADPHVARFARVTLGALGLEVPPVAEPEPTLPADPVLPDDPELLATVEDGLPGQPVLATAPDTSQPIPASDADGLLRQLADLDPAVRRAAAGELSDVIAAHSYEAPQLLNRALSSNDPEVRQAGISALDGYTGDPRTMEPVLRWLAGSTDPQVRAAAARAAARMRLPDVSVPTITVDAGDEAGDAGDVAEAAAEADVAEGEPVADADPMPAAPAGDGAADVVAGPGTDGGSVVVASAEDDGEDLPAAAEPEPITFDPSDVDILDGAGAVIDEADLVVEPSSVVAAPGETPTGGGSDTDTDTDTDTPEGWPREGRIVIHADRPAAQRQRLRVRARPVDGEIIGHLSHGTAVTLLGPPEQGYYPINFNSRRGYISAEPRYTEALEPQPQPDTDQPDQPDTDQPDTDQPDTDQPDTDTPAWPRQGMIVIHADRSPAQRQALRVRARPGSSGSVVGGVTYGQTVTVLGPAEQDYYPIQFDGRRAYVSANPRYVRLTPTQTPTLPQPDEPDDAAPAWPRDGTVVIHADRSPAQRLTLRVRSRPVNGGVVGGLRYGQSITVLGPADRGFYPIRFNGRRAYVSADARHTRLD